MKFLPLLILLIVTTFSYAQEDEEETIQRLITIELETGKKIIVQPGDAVRWEGNSGYTVIIITPVSTKKEIRYTGSDVKEITIVEDTIIKKYHPYKGEGFMKVLLETIHQTESAHILTSPIGFYFLSLNGKKPKVFHPEIDNLIRNLFCLSVNKKYSKSKDNLTTQKMIEILDYYEETCGKK